jgi:hypothetical protein
MVLMASQAGGKQRHAFADTEIEVSVRSFVRVFLWKWRGSITIAAIMRPRGRARTLWLRRTASDKAEYISLELQLPAADVIDDVALVDSCSECGSSAVTYRFKGFPRYPRAVQYALRLTYRGTSYNFAGKLDLYFRQVIGFRV